MQMGGALADVTVEGNRFYKTTDGILFTSSAAARSVQMRLVGNTFCNLNGGLHWEALPKGVLPHDVVVEKNLFAHTGKLAYVNNLRGAPPRLSPILLASKDNVRDSACAEAFPPFAAREVAFSLPADPDHDRSFLRYPKDSPLATKAGSPGVPPVDGP